jgi:N-dimethylarginine dimethylaminohydrolase
VDSSIVAAAPARFFVSATQCSLRCAHRAALGECAYRLARSGHPGDHVGSVNSLRAARQHCVFVRLLERLGAHVEQVPFVHAAFDSVFLKDSAILVRGVCGDRALMTQPRYLQRRSEQASRAVALEHNGFKLEIPPAATLEGGDVLVAPRCENAFMGYGFRTSRAAAPTLERFLGLPVVPLELRDPELYHLDMVLHVLRDGTVVVCKDALTMKSVKDLERATTRDSVICVSLEEARTFAVNLIAIGNNLVSASLSPRVHAKLCARGYVVHMVRLDEFHTAGGSAACLVARVHDYEMTAVGTTRAPASIGSSAA